MNNVRQHPGTMDKYLCVMQKRSRCLRPPRIMFKRRNCMEATSLSLPLPALSHGDWALVHSTPVLIWYKVKVAQEWGSSYGNGKERWRSTDRQQQSTSLTFTLYCFSATSSFCLSSCCHHSHGPLKVSVGTSNDLREGRNFLSEAP